MGKYKNGANLSSNYISSKLNAAFSKISALAARTGTRMKFGIERGIYGASASIAKLIVSASSTTSRVVSLFRKLGSKIPASVILAMSKITSSIKKVAGKTFSFTVKAVDKASSIKKGIASKASGIAKLGMGALLGAGTAGATIGISGMAAREKQLVSIEHFMDVADKKKIMDLI